ncbi:MFS transporter [Candidatus Tisiphia endosymbiont of Ceraclea dissimilis]|uniref:MFS transporter n=1 Tax=Candidatus Tisiphia endosymbiont of Ceraclea dissimilis TaxID=3077928 RepID=UPI003CCB27C6
MLTNHISSYFICFFLLGIVAGGNFSLVTFTIHYQLSQAGYSTDIIGLMFLTSMPYCLKPILAPFIDKYSVPIICKKFGQRRGWAIAVQGCLLVTTSGFLIIAPPVNIVITAILNFTISCCAATQDIILDAYRIERSVTKEELSVATTFSGTGFRIGMLINSTGALYVSCFFNWYCVYLCTFFITMAAPLIILCMQEPATKKTEHIFTNLISFSQYSKIIGDSLLLLKRHHPNWIFIMLFVFLYKASDSITMAMSSPLFIDLSFTSQEIASISKTYGFMLMTLGGIISGILTTKVGISRGLLICGILQLLSPLMLMFLSIVGHDLVIFTITITVQNFCCGLGNTTLVIYLSSLCNGELIATQYSIISSFSSFVRIILSCLSGICANYMDWSNLFLFTTLFSMLFVLAFLKIRKS